ncbi:MAG: hypothetical protein KGV51_05875 [Moraxellaceae bacterium]|nr:hypothetical protein [Moraxellaceae bacterium]
MAENRPAYDLLSNASDTAIDDLMEVLETYDYEAVYCVVIEREDYYNHLVFFNGSIINDETAEKLFSFPIEANE